MQVWAQERQRRIVREIRCLEEEEMDRREGCRLSPGSFSLCVWESQTAPCVNQCVSLCVTNVPQWACLLMNDYMPSSHSVFLYMMENEKEKKAPEIINLDPKIVCLWNRAEMNLIYMEWKKQRNWKDPCDLQLYVKAFWSVNFLSGKLLDTWGLKINHCYELECIQYGLYKSGCFASCPIICRSLNKT